MIAPLTLSVGSLANTPGLPDGMPVRDPDRTPALTDSIGGGCPGSGSLLYGTDALAGTINVITADTPARRESGFRFGGALNTFYSSNENGRRGSLTLNGAWINVPFSTPALQRA